MPLANGLRASVIIQLISQASAAWTLVCCRSTSLFQAVASVCKEDTIASAVASMLLLILMNTG